MPKGAKREGAGLRWYQALWAKAGELVLMVPAFSRTCPSRIRMPRLAAALDPAIMATGVANPMAQGQATMSTGLLQTIQIIFWRLSTHHHKERQQMPNRLLHLRWIVL